MTEPLNLVVALPAEAKPIVAHYQLKRMQPEYGFPVYRREALSLVVSGVGKANSAAATAHLHAVNHFQKDEVWLNVGIAGHAHRSIGDVLLAHQIVDHASGQCWYPPLVMTQDIDTRKLLTLDRPSDGYPEEAMVDMEASGFIATAQRFASSELVHCLKVISDHSQQSVESLNAKRVQALMAVLPESIDGLHQQLGGLVKELAGLRLPEDRVQRYLQLGRFTVSQHHQLEGLLRRWLTLAPASDLWRAEFAGLSAAKPLLQAIRNYVDTLPIQLRP